MKRLLLPLMTAIAIATTANAQEGEFCDAVKAVLNDAPNGFSHVHARVFESNQNAMMWPATVKIPGAKACRVVKSMGQFYEAGLLQTTDKNKLEPVYKKYRDMLTDCLAPLGYKISYQPNFTAGLSDLKKIVFMKDIPENLTVAELPPHVTIEAMYSKDVGGFTIVMIIFEH
jgi:hypothetical protein